MESTVLAVGLVVVWWALTGVLVLLLASVSGAEPPPWGVASALLGPLLLGWALARSRAPRRPVELARGVQGDGDIDVLIVVPRDPTLVALADPILRGLESDLGKVILAWRPDYEPPRHRLRRNRREDDGMACDAEVFRHLSRAALFLSTVDPRLLVLPDRSLRSLHRLVASESVGLAIVCSDDRAAAALRRTHRARGLRVLAPRLGRSRPHHRDRQPNRWPEAGQ